MGVGVMRGQLSLGATRRLGGHLQSDRVTLAWKPFTNFTYEKKRATGIGVYVEIKSEKQALLEYTDKRLKYIGVRYNASNELSIVTLVGILPFGVYADKSRPLATSFHGYIIKADSRVLSVEMWGRSTNYSGNFKPSIKEVLLYTSGGESVYILPAKQTYIHKNKSGMLFNSSRLGDTQQAVLCVMKQDADTGLLIAPTDEEIERWLTTLTIDIGVKL